MLNCSARNAKMKSSWRVETYFVPKRIIHGWHGGERDEQTDNI